MGQKQSSFRERRRNARKRKELGGKVTAALLLGAAGLVVAVLVWNAIGRRPIGESITASGEGNHVPDGSPLPIFSTDPPTSGPHYNSTLQEGFYDTESDDVRFRPNPQGFIVHSMEHGYVVFWYNCDVLPADGCEPLKDEIRSLMESFNNFKIIAFPWSTTDVPVVATSWGRLLEFQTWDADLATSFIENNRNQAPESAAR